tara:strand:- start:517 stop:885 length:369 start_codon:yes stop_codon:yes gene_type:complete
MAYYGTNSVLAQAHWDASNSGNSYFDLKQSFGFSSFTKIANGHYRGSFSSTLDDDYYVVCGSMSAENAASGSDTSVVRGANGFHVHVHSTSQIDVIFAYGTANQSQGNANHGAHMGICVIAN